jgi:hypothetical protein
LSVALVARFGIAGVAFGTLAPALLLGGLGVLPLAAKFVEMSYGQLLRQLFLPALLPIGASLAVLTGLLVLFPIPPAAGLVHCAWRGLLVLAAAFIFALPSFSHTQAKAVGASTA